VETTKQKGGKTPRAKDWKKPAEEQERMQSEMEPQRIQNPFQVIEDSYRKVMKKYCTISTTRGALVDEMPVCYLYVAERAKPSIFKICCELPSSK
jgi:hypothetical protein